MLSKKELEKLAFLKEHLRTCEDGKEELAEYIASIEAKQRIRKETPAAFQVVLDMIEARRGSEKLIKLLALK